MNENGSSYLTFFLEWNRQYACDFHELWSVTSLSKHSELHSDRYKLLEWKYEGKMTKTEMRGGVIWGR